MEEVTQSFDIAVIGAGPAGSSAAITAARLGHRVLLLERGSFPRQKVCGEFVSSEALQLLKGLLGESNILDGAPLIERARIFVDGKVRETTIAPAAKSIPRFVLDAALWESAKSRGVTSVENSVVQEISGDGPFRIVVDGNEYFAKAVINASGRWSNLAEHMRLPKLDASVGLKAHYREARPSESVDLYFFPGGYCGVQPIGADEVNVSAMVLPSVAKDLETVFEQEASLKERSRDWSATTEPVSTYPLVHGKPQPLQAKRNILNVGDAAGFIDPFVGDGISMALHSGRMAAECVHGFLAEDRSLKESALAYNAGYEESLLPAFQSAERLRKLINKPVLRNLAMELFRVPAISKLALRSTRARI